MPVEIKELVIRAVTTTKPEEADDLPPRSPASTNTEAIIQECVRQVLRILKKKKDR
jgi:hypothetical protein